jgi:hypothetical protein
MRSLTSGTNNTAVGSGALINATTGSNNVAIGFCAGAYYGTSNLLSASSSVFIGYEAKAGGNAQSNQIVIGCDAVGRGSNTVQIGNGAITSLAVYRGNGQSSAWNTTSDPRIKEEITLANLDMCLESVKKLPVSRYVFKDFVGKGKDKHVVGFLADDVEKVFPKVITTFDSHYPILDENGNQIYETIETEEINKEGKTIKNTKKVPKTFLLENVKSIDMTIATPTLWGAVQCLNHKVEELESEVDKLKSMRDLC